MSKFLFNVSARATPAARRRSIRNTTGPSPGNAAELRAPKLRDSGPCRPAPPKLPATADAPRRSSPSSSTGACPSRLKRTRKATRRFRASRRLQAWWGFRQFPQRYFDGNNLALWLIWTWLERVCCSLWSLACFTLISEFLPEHCDLAESGECAIFV